MGDYNMRLHDPLTAALRDLERAGEAGARRFVREGSREIVRGAKKNFKGRPRWDHRGNGRTGPAVDRHLQPPHLEKSGEEPGILTGQLRKGIHAERPRRRGASQVEGKVSAMGGPRNLYAGHVEQKYPYMKPAVEDFEKKADELAEECWAEEIGRLGRGRVT